MAGWQGVCAEYLEQLGAERVYQSVDFFFGVLFIMKSHSCAFAELNTKDLFSRTSVQLSTN